MLQVTCQLHVTHHLQTGVCVLAAQRAWLASRHEGMARSPITWAAVQSRGHGLRSVHGWSHGATFREVACLARAVNIEARAAQVWCAEPPVEQPRSQVPRGFMPASCLSAGSGCRADMAGVNSYATPQLT